MFCDMHWVLISYIAHIFLLLFLRRIGRGKVIKRGEREGCLFGRGVILEIKSSGEGKACDLR